MRNLPITESGNTILKIKNSLVPAKNNHANVPDKTENCLHGKFLKFVCDFLLTGFTEVYATRRKILPLPPTHTHTKRNSDYEKVRTCYNLFQYHTIP